MDHQMTVAALIVAAGRGNRAGGAEPKQWQHIAGRPVIEHTLERFARHPRIDRIMVVLHPDDMDRTLALWRERLQSGDPVDVDYRLRLRDGSYRWMRARAAARRAAPQLERHRHRGS